MKVKCKVHMLPTTEQTHIALSYSEGKPYYNKRFWNMEQGQHLYITVPQEVEEVKKNDWYIITKNNGSFPVLLYATVDGGSLGFNSEKIIATTDTLIVPDNGQTDHVPMISTDFIESYCKNPVDEVMVVYENKENSTPLIWENNTIVIESVIPKMYTREIVDAIIGEVYREHYDMHRRGAFDFPDEDDWVEELVKKFPLNNPELMD